MSDLGCYLVCPPFLLEVEPSVSLIKLFLCEFRSRTGLSESLLLLFSVLLLCSPPLLMVFSSFAGAIVKRLEPRRPYDAFEPFSTSLRFLFSMSQSGPAGSILVSLFPLVGDFFLVRRMSVVSESIPFCPLSFAVPFILTLVLLFIDFSSDFFFPPDIRRVFACGGDGKSCSPHNAFFSRRGSSLPGLSLDTLEILRRKQFPYDFPSYCRSRLRGGPGVLFGPPPVAIFADLFTHFGHFAT